MNIIGPVLERQTDVKGILRSLPRWFGIEEALLMYVADSAEKPSFEAELGDHLSGAPIDQGSRKIVICFAAGFGTACSPTSSIGPTAKVLRPASAAGVRPWASSK